MQKNKTLLVWTVSLIAIFALAACGGQLVTQAATEAPQAQPGPGPTETAILEPTLTSTEIPTEKPIEAPTEEPKVAVKHMVIEEPIKTNKEKLSALLSITQKEKALKEKGGTEGSLSDIILEYLKEKGIVATKSEFVNAIEDKGFASNQIEKEITLLKEQGKIKYSRATPKGWSVGD